MIDINILNFHRLEILLHFPSTSSLVVDSARRQLLSILHPYVGPRSLLVDHQTSTRQAAEASPLFAELRIATLESLLALKPLKLSKQLKH
jgi:hypothetical protein